MALQGPARFEIACVFSSNGKVDERHVLAIQAMLQRNGLVTQVRFERPRWVLLLSLSAQGFQEAAEAAQLLKRAKDEDKLCKQRLLAPFSRKRAGWFERFGRDEVFKPSERVRLVEFVLTSLKALCLFDAKQQPLVPLPRGYRAVAARESALSVLQKEGILEFWTPLHEPKVWQSWPALSRIASFAQQQRLVDDIEAYYGSGVAFYFSFVAFFSRALLAGPCFLALVIWLTRPAGESVDNDTTLIPFAAAVVLWGFAFARFWQRQAAELSFRWGTLDLALHPVVRAGFYGQERPSQVSGEPEVHFAAWKRWLFFYPVSCVVTSLMLAVAFLVMCCSLNLQGYVNGPNDVDADGKALLASPIYIEAFAAHSRPGGLFDPLADFWLPSIVPVALHSGVILLLNTLYGRVARVLTIWENHRTVQQHENSLVIKRFLFEMFDCYIALVYIAFYEKDIVKLRSELVALYSVDSFRRVFMESVVPFVLNVRDAREHAGRSELGSELAKDEYESFDDFLEIVVEFGYVCLFAAAFPLAAPLSVLCNQIEMHNDLFKLAHNYRRPRPLAACGIGVWFKIVQGIVWLSASFQVALMALTSEQLKTRAPSFFIDLGSTHAVRTQGYLLIFGIERLLLLVGWAISNLIPAKPRWLYTAVQRQKFVQSLGAAKGKKHD